jgi:DNA adenine methylase
MNYIKPPYCRQGNKQPILNELIDLIPQHLIYCEVFVGSATLFFNKEKADVNILNDLDKDVYYRLKYLQKAPLNKSLYRSDLKTLNSIKFFFNEPPTAIADNILYYKIKACNGFNGKPVNITKNIYKPANPYSIIKNLEFYKDKLKNVKITNKDYSLIIKKYDTPFTFFFLDPPYENTHKTFYNDTDFDYIKLANILQNIKGYFLLTINDSKNIRTLFKNFYIKPIIVKSIGWKNKHTNTHMLRKELIIMNYKLKKTT